MKATKSQAGTLGALRLHLTHDSKQITAAGRATFLEKLKAQVLAEADPDNRLSPKEREHKWELGKSEYFRRLRMKGR